MELLRNKSVGAGSLCALVLALAACATAPAADGIGTVTLDLAGQGASGVTYRLRNATITVTGAAYTRTWNTEDTPDQSSLSDDVPAGDYSVALADGWNLERVTSGGASPVAASLQSPNPAAFSVVAEARTAVAFQFQVGQDAVLTGGGYDITIGISEPPPAPELVAISNVSTTNSSILTFPATASGDAAPSQKLIASSRLLSPSGVAAAGDQLLVADSATGVVSFYSRFAIGNATPIKQFSLVSTSVGSAVGDITVAGSEFYVAARNGVGVFPLTVLSFVQPTRVIAAAADLLNRHFLVDAGQVYVSFSSSSENDIRVYSATVGSTASSPTRIIASATPGFCPSTMTVSGTELFVMDSCNSAIAVFPKTTSGTQLPTRMIRPVGIPAGGAITSFRGELYVVSRDGTKIAVLPASASGDFTPVRVISGADTGLVSINSLLLH